MFTLAPQDTASKLICGLTWSQEGAWTSWPPHQHEKDLEEVYCYFDMPSPKFGLHISYLKTGEVEDIVTHTVHSGTMVQAPVSYTHLLIVRRKRDMSFLTGTSLILVQKRYSSF